MHSTDSQKNLLGPIALEPMREEEGEDKAVEDIFGEVERDERLAGILAIRVNAKGNGGSATERAAKTDDTEKDRGNYQTCKHRLSSEEKRVFEENC